MVRHGPGLPPDPPNAGTAAVLDGRWVSEALVKDALTRATETNRRHILELWDNYKVLSLRTPFSDRLTYEQRSRYHFVDSPTDWYPFAETFAAEVEKYRSHKRPPTLAQALRHSSFFSTY